MMTPTAATWSRSWSRHGTCATLSAGSAPRRATRVHNTRGMGMHRFAAAGHAYNAIADSAMHRHGVPAVDLYAFTRALGLDLYANHVHFHPHIQAR